MEIRMLDSESDVTPVGVSAAYGIEILTPGGNRVRITAKTIGGSDWDSLIIESKSRLMVADGNEAYPYQLTLAFNV